MLSRWLPLLLVLVAMPPLVAESSGSPITPRIFDGDVRDLPRPRAWRPGDPISAVPQRFYFEQRRPVRPTPDPRAELPRGSSTSLSAPTRNFAGQGMTGTIPPDTVGDVGPLHFIQAVNAATIGSPPFDSSSQVTIYDKGSPVPTPRATFRMSALLGGACPGAADPIVIYDEQADRWLLAEIAESLAALCVYISNSGDPVTGGWSLYEIATPGLPDYPKIGVWPTDANGGDGSYVIVTNEGGAVGLTALDRGAMLAAAAMSVQRAELAGTPLNLPTVADLDGAAPPSGAAAIVVRARDTEIDGGPPAPGDLLEMWAYDVDWLDPTQTTIATLPPVDVGEFDSDLCGKYFDCLEQPPGGPLLPPLAWVMMHRLQYRNRGGVERLVGNFVVDANGLDRGGIRWFELQRAGGAWELRDEGTYAPSADDRWMGAIAADAAGNIALGFNVVSPTLFPSLRYTGRRAFDTAGSMTQVERTVRPGIGVEDFPRYGDYAAMSVDPTDGCTFWFTGEYSGVTDWATRVATFRFDGCPCDTPAPAIAATLSVPAENRIDIAWPDSTEANVTSYLVRRSRTEGGPYEVVATLADSSPGVAGGAGYLYSDTSVSGGLVYRYLITALDGSECPSTDGAEVAATATGSCSEPPAFDGIQSAVGRGDSACVADLGWSAANAACGGPVSYRLYRDTAPGFEPSPANLLIDGLSATAATDANQLEEGERYYYLVRAVDESTGLDDGNRIYRTTEVTGFGPGNDQSFFSEDFEDPEVLTTTWSVTPGPGAHQCGAWEPSSLAGYRPFGGSGAFARSNSESCPATSTIMTSPTTDLSDPAIQEVRLSAEVRSFVAAGVDTLVEVRTLTGWETVSTVDGLNGRLTLDVSEQGVGNPAFRVRYTHQNTTANGFFSVDDVEIVAEVGVGEACDTVDAVAPVPPTMTVNRAGASIEIDYDSSSCPAPQYNLLHGSLSEVATLAPSGAACDIAPTTFSWNAPPAGDLYFLIVGYDGLRAESRWGDASNGERNGLDASQRCGAVVKSVEATCP